jgi:hypothetical protein
MTPAKRRVTTPASQGPTRTAPDVPIATDPPPGGDRAPNVRAARSATPVPDEVVTAPVPPPKASPPTETGHVDAEDRARTPSPRRPLALYPLPVWPD